MDGNISGGQNIRFVTAASEGVDMRVFNEK